MPDEKPAARVGDPIAHSSALAGALVGLAVGALAGVAIVATGGLGAIAIGAAIGVAGGAGLAGEYIGASIMGPPTGAIIAGSPNVFINGRPASCVLIGVASCSNEYGAPQPEATGAATVFINGQPAGRVDEQFACSAKIIKGSENVFIGGPSAQILPMTAEVPAWLNAGLQVMAIGGMVLATGGVWAAYGAGAALGGLGGGLLGGWLGGMGGREAAKALGFGETGQRVGEMAGGFLGGALGGGAGFRSGRAFDARYVVTCEGLGSNFGNVKIRPRANKPEWLQRLQEGNEFNKQQSQNYPNNEVMLAKPEGSKGYPRVDSYDPVNSEIISRKNSQLADVEENTGIGYLNELSRRYPPGSKIAEVPSQQAGSGHSNEGLGGQTLKGQQILEVPPQNKPIPQSVLDKADELGIVIRDTNGKIYP